jgi:ubiquinone/menaquinone biosynthesis C-methylase UbiE
MEKRKSDTVPQYYAKNSLVRGLFWRRLMLSLSLTKMNNELKVLDIGAGSGELMELILKKYPGSPVKGIDISLHTKDKDLKKRIKIGDVTKMPFKDNEFDVAFALDTLEHVKDFKKAVLEIRRVLKNKGILIISAPSENTFYKLGRLFEKGTTSMEMANSSRHYYDYGFIKKEARKYMKLEKEKFLPMRWPFNLFNIMRFRKITKG